jgi:SAM-dependent methyltransferase
MAKEFPHCEVLGIDLAPVPLPPENLPPNCRFEMDDINLGLSHLKDQFSVVFARAVGLGLRDFRQSLADVQECLKPGGILIWIDCDFDLYSGWPMKYRPFWSSSNPDGSYIQRNLYGKLIQCKHLASSFIPALL